MSWIRIFGGFWLVLRLHTPTISPHLIPCQDFQLHCTCIRHAHHPPRLSIFIARGKKKQQRGQLVKADRNQKEIGHETAVNNTA